MPDGFRVTGTELGDWWQWFLRQQWQPQGLVYRNGRYVLEDGRMATQPLSQALRGAPQPPPTPGDIRTELTEKYGGAERIPLSDLTDEQAEYLRGLGWTDAPDALGNVWLVMPATAEEPEDTGMAALEEEEAFNRDILERQTALAETQEERDWLYKQWQMKQRRAPQPAEDPRLRALEFENLKLQLMSDPSKWIQLFYLEQVDEAQKAAQARALWSRREQELSRSQAAVSGQVSERTPPSTYRPTPRPVGGRLETGLSRTVAGSPVFTGGVTPEAGAAGILAAQQRAERRALVKKQPPRFKPTQPEIPTALQPFITGGFGSTKITPPSLQAWRRLSPSQQEMFRGYLEFVGRPYMDVLGRLSQEEQAQPRPPRRRTPARQR